PGGCLIAASSEPTDAAPLLATGAWLAPHATGRILPSIRPTTARSPAHRTRVQRGRSLIDVRAACLHPRRRCASGARTPVTDEPDAPGVRRRHRLKKATVRTA